MSWEGLYTCIRRAYCYVHYPKKAPISCCCDIKGWLKIQSFIEFGPVIFYIINTLQRGPGISIADVCVDANANSQIVFRTVWGKEGVGCGGVSYMLLIIEAFLSTRLLSYMNTSNHSSNEFRYRFLNKWNSNFQT